MKITDLEKETKGNRKGYFLHVNKQEAYEIIKSLSGQLSREDGNCERLEWPDFGYFSIAIDFVS